MSTSKPWPEDCASLRIKTFSKRGSGSSRIRSFRATRTWWRPRRRRKRKNDSFIIKFTAVMIDKLHEPLPTALPSIPGTRYDSIPNHSSALALLEALSDENRTFKEQQVGLQSELSKLSRISQGLYQENTSLRMLHRERTRDISRLLSTITINTSESLVDYQHQQFLLH